MEFTEVMNELKKKTYKPVYFLCGEEPYFIDLISDYIENNVLDPAEKEFNQSVLYGRDLDVQTILNEAKRYPMMGQLQVVIVKEAQNIKEIEELSSYFQNPLRSTLLVICYKYKTIDKRTNFGKFLQKSGFLFTSEKVKDWKLAPFISSMVTENNFTIGPKATSMLSDYLGNDLSKIANEIDKLKIILKPGSEITPEVIQRNIGISKDFNIFELTDALGKKDVLKANKIVNYFASNEKEHPALVSIGAIYNYFWKVLQLHLVNGTDEGEIAKAIGVHPYFMKDYTIAKKNYSLDKMKQIMGLLREFDLKSKGFDNTGTSGGELLKELVFRIMH